MQLSNLTRWLPAAVLAAAIAIPAAQAGRPASVQLDPAIAAALTTHSGSAASVTLDPAISAAIRYRPAAVAFDGASPDRLDAYYAAQASQATGSSSSGDSARLFADGPPDRLDAYRAAQLSPTPVVTVSKTGFDWSDAGIGFGAAVGLALLAALAGVGLRREARTGRPIQHLQV